MNDELNVIVVPTINGVIVIDDNNYTGALPGQVLRHSSCND